MKAGLGVGGQLQSEGKESGKGLDQERQSGRGQASLRVIKWRWVRENLRAKG